MHDQLFNPAEGGPFMSLTTVQLTARTNKVVGEMFRDSTQNLVVYWNGSAYIALAATGAIANATTTSTGGVELATTAESKAGTNTGSVGPLVVIPSDIAANTQSNTFLYAVDSGGDDTYVGAFTPTITALTTGMTVWVKVTTANTGACTLDVGVGGALAIKTRAGDDPSDGDVNGTCQFIYNGTNWTLNKSVKTSNTREGIIRQSTDVEALARSIATTSVSPKQLGDFYTQNLWYDELYTLPATTDGTSILGIVGSNGFTAGSCTGNATTFVSNGAQGYIYWNTSGTNSILQATYAKTGIIQFSAWVAHNTNGDTNFGIVTTLSDLSTASYGTTRKVMFNLHTTLTSNIVTCDGTTNTVTSLSTVPSGTPVFYQFIYDVTNASVTAYINGTLKATVVLTLPTGATTYSVGAGISSASQTLSISPPQIRFKHAY